MSNLFIYAQYLAPQHYLSRFAGRLANSNQKKLKEYLINYYIKKYEIDLTEAEIDDPKAYKNFNEFFTRRLKASARPICGNENNIVSPVDGTIYQVGKINYDRIIQAKNRDYSLIELLGGKTQLATQLLNGDFVTLYLAPKDYHRVHMPYGGKLKDMLYIPGKLFSVNPITSQKVPNLFARNERLVCVFETEQGPMVIILVGAMIVGNICLNCMGPITSKTIKQFENKEELLLKTGDELGYFQLGSTVIVLFPENKIIWNPLEENMKIKMGQVLGKYKPPVEGIKIMKTLCMHYYVSGRVQGVWYRANTQAKARELGLKGWVKNLTDGRVELIACGEENSIKLLEAWLWQGPPLAKIDDIEKAEMPLQEFNEFTVE